MRREAGIWSAYMGCGGLQLLNLGKVDTLPRSMGRCEVVRDRAAGDNDCNDIHCDAKSQTIPNEEIIKGIPHLPD